MCGILFTTNPNHSTNDRALSIQNYRGPDNQGHIIIKNCFIGHNRLAIIDVSDASSQPFHNGNSVLTYNGEIYNFQELKKLEKLKNIKFKTNGDTEVLYKGIENDGIYFLQKVRGMFAFTFYNPKTNKLTVARDYYGKKPLYYCIKNGIVTFSSTIAAITEIYSHSELTINTKAIEYYLRFGFFKDGTTPYKEVLEFNNNTYSVFDLNTLKFDHSSEIFTKKSVKGGFEYNFSQSVTLREISDVPIGILLSSGLDSTAIATKIKNKKVSALTVSFDKSFNEFNLSSITTKSLGLNHIEAPCNVSSSSNYLLNIQNFLDIPLGDPSYIPFLMLCEKVKQNASVAISGDGGDELFLGYKRYKYILLIYFFHFLPKVIRQLISTFCFNSRIKSILTSTSFGSGVDKIMAFENEDFLISRPSYAHNIRTLKDYFYAEKRNYLKQNILVKGDMGSMFNQVELRSPFLDFTLTSFGPNSFFNQIKSILSPKVELKKILKKNSLKHLLNQPKRGFTFNLEDVLRNEENKVKYSTKFVIQQLPTLINKIEYEKFENSFFSGKSNDYRSIYKIYILGKWLQNKIEYIPDSVKQ